MRLLGGLGSNPLPTGTKAGHGPITSTHHLGIRDEVAALKRARIITAAVELFYEKGYQSTTLDVVAERLGVTKPFIYAHFTSKSEILAEICSHGIAASIDALDSALPLRVPATEKLRLLSERFVTAALGSQMHIAIFSCASRRRVFLTVASWPRYRQVGRRSVWFVFVLGTRPRAEASAKHGSFGFPATVATGLMGRQHDGAAGLAPGATED